MILRDRRREPLERRRDEQLSEVHEQTVNSHPPEGNNLRDDLDKSISVGESAAASGAVTVRMLNAFRDEVRDAFKEARKDIGGIREELRDERRERAAEDRRIEAAKNRRDEG
ncbi:DUF2746 domain-containing protein [Mycolicibacter heraklionensis]|uniref:DUF2746 domain-containing protein n=1 Tax=Mycolicibacter heraklionensis TaxID=512402 RepID=UPI000D68B08C|nr:DUF2746 domain-containing protein [Mycolicibacter heraklionensis]